MNKINNEETLSAGVLLPLLAHGPLLAVLFALAAFPPLFHDIARDALANADMDIISVNQALMINAGQPVVPFPHTGYAYFLFLAGWLHLFDWLNLVPVTDIKALLATPDFGGVFTDLIIAGRWFSIFLACLLVAMVYASVCMVTKNRLHAFLLGVLFAVGGAGITAQSVMLRTELPSMVFLFAAALALIATPKARSMGALALLAFAGLCIHISLMVKIQGVIVAMFLPLLPFVFGWPERNRSFEMPSRRQLIGVLALAAVTVLPFVVVFLQSLAPESSGFYQAIIAAYLLACALAYGRFFLGSARNGLIGALAVATGFSFAYVLNFINDHWWTTYSIINFIEKMSIFVPAHGGQSALQTEDLSSAKAIIAVAEKIAGGFDITEINRFFTERFRNFDYPFAVLYVAVPASAVVLAVRRKFEAALKITFLCTMAGLIVAVFWAGRGFFNFYYSIYIEAWVILAAGVAVKELAPMTTSWPRRWKTAAQTALVIVLLSVVTINVRFRLLDPAAASPVVAKSACFIRNLTPLIYQKFDGYCA